MLNTNTPTTAVYIRKYKLSFFYENYSNEEDKYIPIMDANGGMEGVAQAACICRLDLQFTNGKELAWERKIGISLTATEDIFTKAQGRQIALLRAVHGLKRDERQMILDNWFREHAGVSKARKGDPKKFVRLVELAGLSTESRSFIAAPFVEELAVK